MSDVLDDETVWFPKGQTTINNAATKSRRLRAATDGDDGDEEDVVFVLGQSDMGALNRYLHGGRVLPLDRTSYCNKTGIVDTSLLTPMIWTKVDELIEAYIQVHADCTGFLGDEDTAIKRWKANPTASATRTETALQRWRAGRKAGQKVTAAADDDDTDFDKLCTWDKMNGLAQNIYSYSEDAGSTDADDSYYVAMLTLCGDYNDSNDPAEQESIRQDILDLTDDLLGDVNKILSHIGKVKEALKLFEASCQTNQSTLEGLEKSMTTILDQELGSIQDLEKEIKKHQDSIISYQAIIDHDRYEQEMTAAYVWIPIAGTIAGPVVFAQMQAEIDKYEGKIEAMNKLIKDEEASKQLHKTLQANVTSMKSHATDLSNLIGPAMHTIEALEGGWNVMGSQVQFIHDKAEKFEEKIPRLSMTKRQLKSISDEWYKLNKYVMSYIQNAQLVVPVQVLSLEDYLQQLKDVANKSS